MDTYFEHKVKELVWKNYINKSLDLSRIETNKHYWLLIKDNEKSDRVIGAIVKYNKVSVFKGAFMYHLDKMIYQYATHLGSGKSERINLGFTTGASNGYSLLETVYKNQWIILPREEKLELMEHTLALQFN